MPSAAAGSTASVAGWRSRLGAARADRRTKYLLTGLAVAVALAVLVGPTLKNYLGQRQEIARLQAQVSAQEKQVADLQAEQRKWDDPAFIEQQARERLKFVKVGEKSYTVIDPQDEAAHVPGMASGKAAGSAPWYATVWSSIHAADAPAAAAP